MISSKNESRSFWRRRLIFSISPRFSAMTCAAVWADCFFSSLTRFSISSAHSARSEYGLRRLEISASRASSRTYGCKHHIVARLFLVQRYDMKRFCGRFCGELGAVRGVDVDTWLRDLKVGPRTRNNLRASVQVLFNYR